MVSRSQGAALLLSALLITIHLSINKRRQDGSSVQVSPMRRDDSRMVQQEALARYFALSRMFDMERKTRYAKSEGMSDSWKYVETTPLRMQEVDTVFDCFQCGAPATCTDYVEVTYKFSGDRLMYAFIECVGDHPRYPVPYEWFQFKMDMLGIPNNPSRP